MSRQCRENRTVWKSTGERPKTWAPRARLSPADAGAIAHRRTPRREGRGSSRNGDRHGRDLPRCFLANIASCRDAMRTAENGAFSTLMNEPKNGRRKIGFVRRVAISAAILGVAGFLFLVFDLFYQGPPDIDVSSATTSDPFSLPFSVRTKSILFDMHRAEFKCAVDLETPDGKFVMVTVDREKQGPLEITRSAPGNYHCDIRFEHLTKQSLRSLKARISVRYCTNIFGFGCWERAPNPILFTWMQSDASGHWLKGDLAP